MGKLRRIAIMNVYAIGLFVLPLIFFNGLWFILAIVLFAFVIPLHAYETPNAESLAVVALFGALTLLGGLGLSAGGRLAVAGVFPFITIPGLNVVAWIWEWKPRPVWTPEQLRRRHLRLASKSASIAACLWFMAGLLAVTLFISEGHIVEFLAWVLFWAAILPGILLLVLALLLRRK